VFDSHCHLHDERVGDAAHSQLERARAAGVRGFLLAGVEPRGWPVEAALVRAHRDVHAAYGVHPQWVAAVDEAEGARAVDALGPALDAGGAVAVGEIGLDAVGERKARLDWQEELFRRQLRIARARALPIVLHVLRAHDRALAILDEEGVGEASGVVHSYSGSVDQARRYLALGLHLSLAGPVTFANANKARVVAGTLPAARLLVETDAPDQTPEPHRPGPNEPAFLPAIVAAVAAARGEPVAQVAAYTDENARRLFRLPR
jgi:TatD DNase family protein